MFCLFCGRGLGETLQFCDGCGSAVNRGAVAVPLSQQLKSEVRARSRDAWQGIRLFAKSPVGGLPQSFALFDDKRALQVGIVFAIVFDLALSAGFLIFQTKVANNLLGA